MAGSVEPFGKDEQGRLRRAFDLAWIGLRNELSPAKRKNARKHLAVIIAGVGLAGGLEAEELARVALMVFSIVSKEDQRR